MADGTTGVVAALTAVAAVVSAAVGATTPPRSGAYCRGDCVTYPYTDVAAFVPRDYLWMYPTLVMVLAFQVLAVCLLGRMPPERRPLGAAGVSLVVVGSGALLVDYALQLTVLQPALLRGESAGLSLLSQYNPQGVFIGLENVGYTLFNVAFVLLGVALSGDATRPVRAASRVLRAGRALTLLALVGYGATYRLGIGSRYEVAALAVTWLVLAAVGVLLTVATRRASRFLGVGG